MYVECADILTFSQLMLRIRPPTSSLSWGGHSRGLKLMSGQVGKGSEMSMLRNATFSTLKPPYALPPQRRSKMPPHQYGYCVRRAGRREGKPSVNQVW